MSHEALKFNVHTKDQTKWQPIVGCQDYGTFYMVYIKFTNYEEKDDLFYYSAEFKLQNYNGSITMGFDGAPELIELDDQQKKDREEELLKIMKSEGITDENEQQRLLKEHRIDFYLKLKVKPFDLDFHIPKTALQPTSKKLSDCILETDCIRMQPPFNLYDQNRPQQSKYINPYHYARAGDETHIVGFKNMNSNNPFIHIGQAGTWLTNCNPNRSFLF